MHIPITEESMFLANLAVYASSVFEAWQTTPDGKQCYTSHMPRALPTQQNSGIPRSRPRSYYLNRIYPNFLSC